jgi:hypothetical protein
MVITYQTKNQAMLPQRMPADRVSAREEALWHPVVPFPARWVPTGTGS